MLTTIRLLFDLLPPGRRHALPMLALLLLLNAALELASIGSVVPLIAVVIDPSHVPAWVSLPWLAVAILGLSLLAGACSALATRASFALCVEMRQYLGHELLARMLAHPYAWFLRRNTADLATTVVADVDTVVDRGFIALSEALVNGAVAAVILGALLVVEPVVALGLGLLLGLAYLLVHRAVEVRMQRTGAAWREADAARFQTLFEALSSVKEARLFQHREHLVARFDAPSRRLVDVLVRHRTLSLLPRLCVDALVIGAVVGICLLLTLRGDPPTVVVSRILFYIMAIWRVTPALEGLYKGLQNTLVARPVLLRLREEMAAPVPVDEVVEPLPLREALALDDVTFAYDERVVLPSVSLRIPRGAWIAIVGPTGAGKTTLLDIAAGLLPPTSGTVTVDGVPLVGHIARRWLSSVGYVPQEVYLIDDTVTANIAFGIETPDLDAVQRATRLAGLADVVTELENGYDTVVGERGKRLSGGQRQRVGIARALYHDPALLILDEATSGLDAETEASVLEGLRAQAGDKAVLLVSHRASALAYVDTVFEVGVAQEPTRPRG